MTASHLAWENWLCKLQNLWNGKVKYHKVTQVISAQLQLQVQTCKTGNQVYTMRLVHILDFEKIISSIYIYHKTTVLINPSFHKQKTQSYLSSLVQTSQKLWYFNR